MKIEVSVKFVDPELSHRPLHVEIDATGHARAVVHTLDVEFDVAPPAFPNETVWELLRRVVEAGQPATGIAPKARVMTMASKPRRFLVFFYSDFYPLGGWEDMCGSFDTFEEARECARTGAGARLGTWERSKTPDNIVIVDIETGENIIVAQGRP